MKDNVKVLIETYKSKLVYLDKIDKEVKDNLSKQRIATKKAVYTDIIIDLEQILQDGKEVSS